MASLTADMSPETEYPDPGRPRSTIAPSSVGCDHTVGHGLFSFVHSGGAIHPEPQGPEQKGPAQWGSAVWWEQWPVGHPGKVPALPVDASPFPKPSAPGGFKSFLFLVSTCGLLSSPHVKGL